MNMSFYHIWPQTSNLQQIVRTEKYFHILIIYTTAQKKKNTPGKMKSVTVGSKSFRKIITMIII